MASFASPSFLSASHTVISLSVRWWLVVTRGQAVNAFSESVYDDAVPDVSRIARWPRVGAKRRSIHLGKLLSSDPEATLPSSRPRKLACVLEARRLEPSSAMDGIFCRIGFYASWQRSVDCSRGITRVEDGDIDPRQRDAWGKNLWSTDFYLAAIFYIIRRKGERQGENERVGWLINSCSFSFPVIDERLLALSREGRLVYNRKWCLLLFRGAMWFFLSRLLNWFPLSVAQKRQLFAVRTCSCYTS